MTSRIFLVLALAACSERPLLTPDVADSMPTVTASDNCSTSIDALCDDSACWFEGNVFPNHLDGWCANSDADGLITSTPCGSLTQIELLDGDQGVEMYYDANGAPFALTQWVSDPPCNGACQLVCVAGPTTSTPWSAPACSTGNASAVARCSQ